MDTMDAKFIDNNTISTATYDKSVILHTPGGCEDNGTTTPTFTPLNNPTPDNNKDNGCKDYKIEQVEPQEEDAPELVTIESDEEESDDKEKY